MPLLILQTGAYNSLLFKNVSYKNNLTVCLEKVEVKYYITNKKILKIYFWMLNCVAPVVSVCVQGEPGWGKIRNISLEHDGGWGIIKGGGSIRTFEETV